MYTKFLFMVVAKELFFFIQVVINGKMLNPKRKIFSLEVVSD